MRFRRAYYDLFSHVYDRVIALHSGDASARPRGKVDPENRDFARDEVPYVRRYFAHVRRELSPQGRSKLILGNKREGAETAG